MCAIISNKEYTSEYDKAVMKDTSISPVLYHILISIFLFSSCDSFLHVKSKSELKINQLKILRFDKFITHSSLISCGITRDKKLFCNEQRIEKGSSLFEQTIPSGWPVKMVDTGRNHICAIFEGPFHDEVWCKGIGSSGQLGDGLSLTSNVLVKVVGLPTKRILDLGSENIGSCAVTEDKDVYCWGSGYFPNGVASPSSTAFKTLLTGVIDIKGTYSSYCALKEDKSLWCWGSGTNGNLGQGDILTHAYTPFRVKDSLGTGFLQNVDDFAVGQQHTCAIINQEVYCWGLSRAVGVDQDPATTLPRHMPELSGTIKIEAGDFHTCALLDTGDVYCWGRNKSLQVGGVLDVHVLTPKKVDFPQSVGEIVDLSLGNGTNPTSARSCVLNKSGEIYCWGTTANGIFGSIDPLITKTFTFQPSLNASSVNISSGQMCLINNNLPYSSGYNDYAQFDSDRYAIGTPLLMSNDTVTDFDCSRYANCYVSSNKLFCKGLNFTARQEITALGSGVAKAVLATHSTCALMLNKDLYCWGLNANGQIGNGTTATVVVTAPYLAMTNVVAADGGANVFCAIKSDKSVWCWGANSAGTVGHDNTLEVNVTTPVLVKGLPDLTSATTLNLKVESQTACLQVDKDIYCWGASIGTLLHLGSDYTFKAYKLSALSGNIKKIAIINMGVCVSYDDFSISCLSNSSSLLFAFDYEYIHKKTFAPIGPIADLGGGTYLLCQVLTNGKLYCLGNNSYGGMAHEGIAPPLVLNPSKWQP